MILFCFSPRHPEEVVRHGQGEAGVVVLHIAVQPELYRIPEDETGV